jgi:hypothetical protein
VHALLVSDASLVLTSFCLSGFALLFHSTLLDPLRFGGDWDDYNQKYIALCAANATQWEAVKLNKIAQERQEDWMALWVTEMVRIAKPGAPVITEAVALPFCDEVGDYGGVSKEFWPRAIDKYGWDVDPASLVFGKDKHYDPGRYHVALKKNK